MGVVDDLLGARAAYDRRDWLAAYGGLSEAGADELTADDFVRLATAAYLVGRRNDCVQALQRAHQLHLETGDVLAAVRAAFWLGFVLLMNGETAVGGGWVGRAQRLVDDVDSDIVERGYVCIDVMLGASSPVTSPRRWSCPSRSPISGAASSILTWSRWG